MRSDGRQRRGRSNRGELARAARADDVDAQFELACTYDFERPKNRRSAIHWYTKAAEQGYPGALNYLGESYRDGWSAPVDRRRAVRLFRQAAARGDDDAMLSLGHALFYGKGIRRDRPAALRWYRRAARAGNDGAMVNLGHMYRRGHVVPQSWTAAIRWYRAAAESGHTAALHWWPIYDGLEDYPERRRRGRQVG